jgi:hypothetical protein
VSLLVEKQRGIRHSFRDFDNYPRHLPRSTTEATGTLPLSRSETPLPTVPGVEIPLRLSRVSLVRVGGRGGARTSAGVPGRGSSLPDGVPSRVEVNVVRPRPAI